MAPFGNFWGHGSRGGYSSANPNRTLLLIEPCHSSAINMFLPLPRWPNGAASGLVQASFQWYTAAGAACTIVKPGHAGI